jgi:hypothetical protein
MPVAMFSHFQVGPIIVATGADDFTEPIATVIFIATCTGWVLHGPIGWPLVHIRARTDVSQWARRVLAHGASCGQCSVGNLFMQSKRK